MTPEVEAVAQALLDRFRARIAARGGEMPCAAKIRECVPSYRDDFIADAEAAIAAMPRPSLLRPATKAIAPDITTPEGAKQASDNARWYRENLKPFA